MPTHAEHHFVPRFLLEQWHTPPDSKLSSFRWAGTNLVSHRYKAKSVAKERHLYSLSRSSDEPDVQLEKNFWGPQVDDPAATVHAKMLREGPNALQRGDRMIWARFLVGLMLRVPGMVRRIRERGREVLSAGLDEAPEDYLEVRGVATERPLREWVETHMPDALDDLGVMTLPQLVFSEKLNPVLLKATWGIRSVHLARFDLLMGDRPLTVAGALGASFLVALPISPTKIFLALNDPGTLENVQKRDADAFVRDSNLSMVTAAETYVYSTGQAQTTFIAKHLRRR
jgi:hypothetical protein